MQIADPEMAWLFENCFPSTLDTTVGFRERDDEGGEPDTFVISGDIDAMWLRDSAAQVWPYLPLAAKAPASIVFFKASSAASPSASASIPTPLPSSPTRLGRTSGAATTRR